MTGNIKLVVRNRYAQAAQTNSGCCGPSDSVKSLEIGYSAEDLAKLPEGADLGLGCGNPLALAAVRPGDVILDLGSGAGIDCFLAAQAVGPEGRVIGVDMTPQMVERARRNAELTRFTNVEFRLGEIEALPADDSSVDLIISNCVINLVPDKRRAFDEAFRVLKPGGRLSVSDMVLIADLPDSVKDSPEAYSRCISGAIPKEEYLARIADAGFTEVRIVEEHGARPAEDPETARAKEALASVKVQAVKPE